MLKPQTLRPLMIINLCFFLLHWGGLSSIKPYLVHVLQNFGLGEAASWTTVTITEVRGVFKKRPNFLNSAPTSIESALRLLSAHSGRFWQQAAICPVCFRGVPREGYGCVLSFG